ncbi:MAG: ABC transporter ATP-binding protein [Anaerolineaceae bacterium]|nr:ABC transporter ATP-binding protein [Anaerolineaceae bacterium]
MKTVLSYLKHYRKEAILGPLFKLLEASFELLIPLVVANIIDVGIARGDESVIIRDAILMAVLGLVGMLFSITAQYFSAKAAVGLAATLRHELFDHIQSLSYSKAQSIGTSTLLTRITSDINQVQTGLNLALRLLLRSPFIVFGAMIMAFTVNVRAAMIFVVTIPLLALVIFGIMKITTPLYKKVQSRLDGLLGMTRQNLTGVRVIRAFNNEGKELADFESGNEALTKMQQHVGRISALMNPLTYVIINGATAVLIYYGALRVNVGELTQGQVVALVNYMSQILVELIKFANLIVTISKSMASAERIQDVLQIEAGMHITDDKGKTGNNCIEFEHVSLTYPNAGAESLTDIHFRVGHGQTLGIIGGTGSGKSSVVNLIPRFFDATKGTVRVDGRDVQSYDPEDLRGKIGLVPQKAVLFKGTIRSNLRMSDPDASDEGMWEALRIAQAEDFVRGKKGELDAEVAQEGRNFSGGQRQRLTIARALVRRPEILILDDSASALDYMTDANLRRTIRQADPEMTVVIVSQRTSSVRFCDQILVLDDGHAVGLGKHDDLLVSCPVYREIYESQFRKESDGKEAGSNEE